MIMPHMNYSSLFWMCSLKASPWTYIGVAEYSELRIMEPNTHAMPLKSLINQTNQGETDCSVEGKKTQQSSDTMLSTTVNVLVIQMMKLL